jgi:plasmid stability protein
MATTLTVRTDETLRRALRRRAQAVGKTISALVREILEEALTEHSIAARAGHLKGRLDLPRGDDEDAWRRQLRERNSIALQVSSSPPARPSLRRCTS